VGRLPVASISRAGIGRIRSGGRLGPSRNDCRAGGTDGEVARCFRCRVGSDPVRFIDGVDGGSVVGRTGWWITADGRFAVAVIGERGHTPSTGARADLDARGS